MIRILPIILFLLTATALGVGLSLESEKIPSALIDEPVPDFSLPPGAGRTQGFSSDDLKQGKVSLVNVFASWCLPCRVEHPFLMELAHNGQVPVFAINYKDDPERAQAFLTDLGDPFTRVGDDANGRVGIEWGVYGVPETFVVSGDGIILYKHIGPLTRAAVARIIRPIIAEQSP